MADKSAKWITALRDGIRRQCGDGWMVRGVGNGLLQRVQLTVRFDDGTRTSIILGPKAKTDPDFIPWVATSADWILKISTEISELMKDQGKGLTDAYELVKKRNESGAGGEFDWERLLKKFKSHKTSKSKNGARVWNRNYRTPLARTVVILTSQPEPSSGYTLLKALIERHGGEPGSTSRRLRIQYAAEFLRFAFKHGANRRWLPPEDLKTLIGEKSVDFTQNNVNTV
ncbi:hypothetical protein PMIT1342_00621 [Prochlorococcus marinus str. MIT 1342]|uniref:hypothetical protein n=1 Tax=Prochlorococcus TaxID=1218 RepID=UPI0007B3915F|nr:hypothetical protein [Prochlorococcus marinus]KZR82970.1 hypothetical protein PMIT1342_00621 [Prochlorococcus marinus str. MIT 1342]